MIPARTRMPLRRPELLLERPRLAGALLDHVDRALQLVVSPAGFGKTTVLTEFVTAAGMPVAWITCTPFDADLADFATRLVAALREREPQFGGRVLATLDGGADISQAAAGLARAFATDLEEHLGDTTLLVLDDFHTVNPSPTVSTFLNHLLRQMPPQLRLIIGSRAVPNLSLHRLMLDGDLFSVGVQDLRFTDSELHALVQHRRMTGLSEEQTQRLAAQMEGWVTGFLIAAPQLRTALGGGGLEQRGSTALVYEYLASEVFEQQPVEVQQFLLATAVPSTASAAICRVLLDDGPWEDLIDRIERAGLFVTAIEGDDNAFRYHQLFREFLLTRLRRVAPVDYEQLHRRAAEYLAGQDAWQEALELYRRVGATGEIVQLLARLAPQLFDQFRWEPLDRELRLLTVEQLRDYPELLLIGSWAAQRAEDFPRGATYADAARIAARDGGDAGLEAQAVARLGTIYARQGRMREARDLYDEARRLAPQDSALQALTDYYEGQVLGNSGDITAALEKFQNALAYFEEAGPANRAADAETALAFGLLRQGQLTAAAARYQSVRARWQMLGAHDLAAQTLLNLAQIHVQLGAYATAQGLLAEAHEQAQTLASVQLEAITHRIMLNLRLSEGRVDAAMAAAEEGLRLIALEGTTLGKQRMHEDVALVYAMAGNEAEGERHAYLALSYARDRAQLLNVANIMVLLGAVTSRSQPEQAREMLDQALRDLTRFGALWDLARAHTWLADICLRLGDDAASLDHLRAALSLTETFGSDALFDLHLHWNTAPFELAFSAGLEPERLGAILLRAAATPAAVSVHGDEPAPAPAGVAARLPTFQVRGFGIGTVTSPDNGLVTWKRDKSRELYFLLLQQGPQRHDQLTEELWPDSPPSKAAASLHTALSQLRRALHHKAVDRIDGMYRVNDAMVESYDVQTFESLLKDVRGKPDAGASGILEQVAELYRGPFLSETASEWCERERERLDQLCQTALVRLSDFLATTGNHQAALTAAERLVKLNPYREDAHARIIRAHLRLGDRAAAVSHFQYCVKFLREELGVQPGPELMALVRHRDS